MRVLLHTQDTLGEMREDRRLGTASRSEELERKVIIQYHEVMKLPVKSRRELIIPIIRIY